MVLHQMNTQQNKQSAKREPSILKQIVGAGSGVIEGVSGGKSLFIFDRKLLGVTGTPEDHL